VPVVYCTLILDEGDSGGNLLSSGWASLVLSQRTPVPTSDIIIGQAGVQAEFRGAASPSVRLPCNDTFGPQGDSGPETAYTITYNDVDGAPAPWSFQLLSTNNDGSGQQRLSALAQAPSGLTFYQFVPLPNTPPADTTKVLGLSSADPLVTEWVAGGGGGGSGTVTSVSVASANGLAGTVANPSTTPAITLKTTVQGLLKGNSSTGVVSAAVSGTDYAPATSGSAILKGNGSGGFSSAAAGTDYVAPTGSGAGLTGITVSQVSGAAPLASPALTGTPTAPTAAALTDSTQIATTAYADAAVAVETARAEAAEAVKAPLASPTFTGTVTVPATVNATDAAQKAYVDSVAQGLDNKPSVTVLAAANITLSGTQTIDGVTVTAGQRVLATGQSTASQNGIWTVASGSWTRPADFASGSSQLGTSVFVEGGTSNSSSGWVLTGTNAVTVDTSAQTWTQFSGAGEINAGTGLSKSGNTLSLALTSLLVSAAGALLAGSNLSDLANAGTARSNLGLGSAATQASSAFDTAGAAAAAAAASLPLAGGTMAGWLAPKVFTLTDGSSVAINAALGTVARWPLGGASHTLAAPSNPVDGQLLILRIIYGGSFTPLFNAIYDFTAVAAPTWTATNGKVDEAGFRYNADANSAAGAWAFIGALLGL
jgi:hypothetical protein